MINIHRMCIVCYYTIIHIIHTYTSIEIRWELCVLCIQSSLSVLFINSRLQIHSHSHRHRHQRLHAYIWCGEWSTQHSNILDKRIIQTISTSSRNSNDDERRPKHFIVSVGVSLIVKIYAKFFISFGCFTHLFLFNFNFCPLIKFRMFLFFNSMNTNVQANENCIELQSNTEFHR